MLFLSFVIFTILVGWWFATIELPAGFSGLVATEVIRNRYLGLMILLSLIIGGCIFSGSYVEALNEKALLTVPGSAVIIAVSASLAVLINFRLSKFSSICYAVMGALVGWNLVNGFGFDFLLILKYILVWLVVPLLSGFIASLLYRIYRFFIHRSKIHLLMLIPYLRSGLLLVAVIFMILIGINNGALLIILNKTISSGFDFSWNGIYIGEEFILFTFSVILLGVLMWNKASDKMSEMAEREFDVNIEFLLLTLMSGVIVLGIFSIPAFVDFLHLPLTPLSIAGIVLGGFAGINLVRGKNGTSYAEEFRMLLSSLTTPLTSFILAVFIFNIVDIKTLLSNDMEMINHSREIINIMPVITSILILILFSLLFVYFRKQQRRKTQAEIVLLENQNKLFENQKAMSAMEIRTVVAENENLNAKLELRRKELINIALSITEQKKFQEKLYNEIKLLKGKEHIEDLKKGIGEIEKELIQKMNYSQELKSFYAQVESLHKDFNLRLTEKFPKLTEQERRLTVLLRLGFSSKHIASLMNIAPKSVEISRYRLRTKMGLSRNDNLIQFIKLI